MKLVVSLIIFQLYYINNYSIRHESGDQGLVGIAQRINLFNKDRTGWGMYILMSNSVHGNRRLLKKYILGQLCHALSMLTKTEYRAETTRKGLILLTFNKNDILPPSECLSGPIDHEVLCVSQALWGSTRIAHSRGRS